MKKRLTIEQLDVSYAKVGLKLLDRKYVNVGTRMQAECLSCGYIYPSRPNHVRSGHGCRNCSGYLKKTPKQVEDKMLSDGWIVNGEDYSEAHGKMPVCCHECLTQHEVSYHISHKVGCPNPECVRHKGKKIATKLYIGICVNETGSRFWKIGITSRGSMSDRYSMSSVPPVGKIVKTKCLFFKDLGRYAKPDEDSLLTYCIELLGKPVAGKEWFNVPSKSTQVNIVRKTKCITQGI